MRPPKGILSSKNWKFLAANGTSLGMQVRMGLDPEIESRRACPELGERGRLRIRAVQISGRTGCWTAQLAECVEENAGQQNRVGCRCADSVHPLHWSSAVVSHSS